MDVDELFEAGSALAARLRAAGSYGSADELLGRAHVLAGELSEAERVETLDAHPPIGADPTRLSAASREEQGSDVVPELEDLNRRYEERFGFRFVTFVDRRSRREVLEELRGRLERTRAEELAAGLQAVLAIAADRVRRQRFEVSYGKAEIAVYRAYAAPLRDVAPIPESSFTGRENLLLAAVVTLDVFGDEFLASYTEGDNSQIVATDTMKNFVHEQALVYAGATVEGLAAHVAERFLATYPQAGRVRVGARELPFAAHSERLLSEVGGDHAWVELDADRSGLRGLRCGRRDLRLLKLTGSRFAGFQRDHFTTLPERADRPLFIYLDVLWRYREPRAGVEGGEGYVPPEQVRDVVRAVFEEFVSLSIQHLVHEMGRRLLERFGQLAEVSFEAQNRLWDTAAEPAPGGGEDRRRVYTEPRPAHGRIGLTMRRG
jgi:urate oxidase/2-oxo-4-hydroxy-4-carboxy-5-ureidoimidazoline decarboxylase